MDNDRIKVRPGVTIFRRYRQWWLDLREGGKRTRKPLGTEDREAAMRLALDGKAPGARKLAALVDDFLAYKGGRGRRPNTLDRYGRILRALVGDIGDLYADRVTRDALEAWQETRLRAVSAGTANTELTHLRSFFGWLHKRGAINSDPTSGIERARQMKADRSTWTPHDFERIVKAVERDDFLRDWAFVAANVGLRPSEQSHLRACDFADGFLKVSPWGDWIPKTWERRELKANAEAASVLSRRKLAAGGDHGLLFASEAGTVVDLRNLYHRFERVMPGGIERGGLYEYRHYFATRMIEQGWPVEKLKTYMGHSSISTTLRYYVHLRSRDVGAPPVVTRSVATG